MKSLFSTLQTLMVAMMATLAVVSCGDREYDEPPVNDGSVVIAEEDQITIGEIKALYQNGKTQITSDKWMRGVVAGDDEFGNIYRTLILQDDTDGITVSVDKNNLHTLFFAGREVFVKVKDLYIGKYRGLLQIGVLNGSDIGRIPETIVDNIVVPGKLVGVEPVTVKIKDLDDSYQSRLIKIDDVEFSASLIGLPYATSEGPNGPQGENRILLDCDGNSVIVRNSGYSDFVDEKLPTGNGSITAIYGVYNSDPQLTVRDLSDVNMMGERCDGGTGGGKVSIEDVRKAFATGSTTAPAGYIEGVVISDYTTASIVSRNLVVQDGAFGITLRFGDDANIPLNSTVKVPITGAELGEFRGLLQINNLNLGAVEVLNASGAVAPNEVTVEALKNDFELYESSLVKIVNATMSGGATYAGSLTVADATGDIPMFTFNSATFANDPVPSGNVSVTAIASQYDDPQVILRSSTDVEGGNSGGPTGDRITVESLRSAFAGGAMTAPEGYVEGVVISDYQNGNMTGRNLVIQDGNSGIVLRFDAEHAYPVNATLKVFVNNLELSEYNGLLQVNNVPASFATVLNNSGSVTPRNVTVSEILSNFETYESTLVTINMASLSGQATFGGAVNVNDGTGDIELFTRNSATFASDALPTGSVNLTAIVSEFEKPQIVLRSAADFGGGNMGGDDFREDFEGGEDFEPFAAAGWDNLAVTGTRQWIKRSYDNNGYVEAKGYQENSANIETWLITPAFNVDELSTMSFQSATAYHTHDGLTVYISPAFTNVADAVWTKLNPNLAGSGEENYEWVESGDVSLPGSGMVRVGFKYEGDNSSNTGTFIIDNVVIR